MCDKIDTRGESEIVDPFGDSEEGLHNSLSYAAFRVCGALILYHAFNITLFIVNELSIQLQLNIVSE